MPDVEKLLRALLKICLILLPCTCWAAEAPEKSVSRTSAERLFAVRVLPLLKSKCYACHGDDPREIKGEFDLRSRESMLKGGESGEPALVPGKPAASVLYKAVRWDGLEMPPKENDRLTGEQIGWIEQWIAAGAPWPSVARQKELIAQNWESGNAGDGVLVATSGGLDESWTHRPYKPADLWAYRAVVKPTVPRQYAGSSTNPVDAFINRKIAAAELPVAKRADRLTLIRRATFDLTGLPPTPKQVAAFVNDDSPDAFRKLVDRLLDSPRYGEQWGKHWLDVVRYADSSGFSNDFERPNAWRYRDYVIRAFNADKPYDQFVREQIAGDEISRQKKKVESKREAEDAEGLIAVGFLRMGPWEHTGMSVAAVTRQQYLDDITNSVGVTFLGHELRCAKCHDHKFDPIPTRDYYRMQAVFAPLQFADRQVPFLDVEKTNGQAAARTRLEKLKAAGGVKSLRKIPKVDWPVDSFDEESEKKGHAKVNKKRGQMLAHAGKIYQPLAFSVYSGPLRAASSHTVITKMPGPKQMQGPVESIHILKGGALESPGEEVKPGVLSVVFGVAQAASPGESAAVTSSMRGRRSALADWIASPENPLTARVMVNRIWQQHFGRAIAGNPNNFGKTGQKPTHPELLDYLAATFVDEGWSIKAMHRLIMLSEAYQRSSTHPDFKRASEIDPDNQWLSRFTPRRLSAEELRDSMLQVSGELNLEMGGIPARPEINMEVAMQPRHIMGSVGPAYQPMRTPAERNRRTVYSQRIRTLRDPLLEVFNQPGFDTSCERRDSSTITPQAFALFNGQNSHDRALAMARRVEQQAETLDLRIDVAFELAFQRQPTADERAQCRQHVAKLTKHHRRTKPVRVEPPRYVVRQMVEEMTGLSFYWVEDLDVYHDYVADLKPWEVGPETRALADLCLVLLNANEFVYVY